MNQFYRHMRKNLFNSKSVSMEVTLALILFSIALMYSHISVVINLLYFIIILEITRMIVEYIKSPTHRVKIRYLVDAAIVGDIRELIIIIVDSHKLAEHLFALETYFAILFALLIVRVIVLKISPDGFEYKSN
jgi:uncharacterized membrane protein (DUF373 family)